MHAPPSRATIRPERKLKEGSENEYETVMTDRVLNAMTPIWRKNRSEVSKEEYTDFYRETFHDFSEPARTITSHSEGIISYDALLFFPSRPPFDYYSKDYKKGLRLYANGVLISDSVAELLPDCFGFVKGLVDSPDLSLNISREMLQQDKQMRLIAKNLERKIKNELAAMLRDDREKYESFFEAFGLQIKFGIYASYGANRDLLQDLLVFRSSFEDRYVTLEEYVSRMKEDQKAIYFASGSDIERIKALPQTELVREKGYEILYFTDDVDEFVARILGQYQQKSFVSVSSSDLDVSTDEEKEAYKQQTEQYADVFDFMVEALGGKVKDVKISTRLKDHPVCLTSIGGISIEMEKIYNAVPNNEKIHAERVLEINSDHPIWAKLCALYKEDQNKLKAYCEILYLQAQLIEGILVDDPVDYSNKIIDLML